MLAAYDHAARTGSFAGVMQEFEKRTGRPIEVVEAEWRRSCVGEWGAQAWDSNGARLLECATREGERWLRELVAARRSVLAADQGGTPEVGWSAPRSLTCRQHALYLAANKRERGPDREQTQDLFLPGATASGRRFAPAALVGIGRQPARVIAGWIDLPGYRDALLDPHLKVVGLFADDGVAVLDVSTEPSPGRERKHAIWPRDGAVKVPRSIDVELLGERVQEELLQEGHGRARKVGYPLSYHSWDPGYIWDDTRCIVTQGGEPLPGVFLRETGLKRGRVPGLLVFVPFEPFGAGEVLVRFEEDYDKDGEFEVMLDARFTTR